MRRVEAGSLALVLLTGLGGASFTRADAVQDELKALSGTWQLLSAETEGEPAPADRIKNVRVVIEGGTSTVYFGEQKVAHSGRVTVNPAARPKEVDDYPSGPDLDGKVIRGIYRIDGDTLTSCVGKLDGERPRKFATSKGSGGTLRVFRRVRNESPAAAADREKLQGRWYYISMEYEGHSIPGNDFVNHRLEFRGGEMISEDNKDTFHASYSLDPTTRPKSINVTFHDGPGRGKTYLGIYELDDETYRVCMALPGFARPREFKSVIGDATGVQILKRVR